MFVTEPVEFFDGTRQIRQVFQNVDGQDAVEEIVGKVELGLAIPNAGPDPREARLEPLDPNTIVQSALDVFSGRLDGIRVRATLEPDLPLIRADAEQLRRVLVNLIDNAAESMEGSSVRELTVATRLDTDRETVTLIIADSGHGISPEDKDKLFLPHFSTKDRGTGLGLAISSRIVAEHNGILRVEDNTPVGARFILQIPVAEVRTAPLSTES